MIDIQSSSVFTNYPLLLSRIFYNFKKEFVRGEWDEITFTISKTEGYHYRVFKFMLFHISVM